MPQKSDYLNGVIEHIDIKEHNVAPLVDAMEKMAFRLGTLIEPPEFMI